MIVLLKSIALLFILAQCRPTIAVTMEEYFKNINGNLMNIKWAHAVDTVHLLDKALKDRDLMMMEADVAFDDVKKIAVMANGDNQGYDLDLEKFMSKIADFNQKNYELRKGVKLDFKSIDALKGSVHAINMYKDQFPIWIHGDIINDYQVKNATTLDAGKFLDICIPLINVRFSFGWPTPRSYSRPAPETYYTGVLVDQMYITIKSFDGSRHNTIFSVRAGLVANANSARAVKELLNWTSGARLTIWSLESDYVSIEELNRLINDVGVDRIYLDAPAKLRDQIQINKKSSGDKNLATGLLVAITSFLYIYL